MGPRQEQKAEIDDIFREFEEGFDDEDESRYLIPSELEKLRDQENKNQKIREIRKAASRHKAKKNNLSH